MVNPTLTTAVRGIRNLIAVLGLPLPVARFYVRALLLARKRGDTWSLAVAARPIELAQLVALCRDARCVVEIGTGTGWTALACALAAPRARVVTMDVEARPHRVAYQRLVPHEVAARITWLERAGENRPHNMDGVDIVFIDGDHSAEATRGAFLAWHDALRPGGTALFHDWGDRQYPGVEEAVRRLGLRGTSRGRLFAWTKPA